MLAGASSSSFGIFGDHRVGVRGVLSTLAALGSRSVIGPFLDRVLRLVQFALGQSQPPQFAPSPGTSRSMPGNAPTSENQKLVRDGTASNRVPSSCPEIASPVSSQRLPVSLSTITPPSGLKFSPIPATSLKKGWAPGLVLPRTSTTILRPPTESLTSHCLPGTRK